MDLVTNIYKGSILNAFRNQWYIRDGYLAKEFYNLMGKIPHVYK